MIRKEMLLNLQVSSSSLLFSLNEIFPELENGGQTAGWQAGMQLAAIAVTLVIAVPGGIITGNKKYFFYSEQPLVAFLVKLLFVN